MTDVGSEEDYEGAALWNGIAKDICPLVKGGAAFVGRVSQIIPLLFRMVLIDQVNEQEQ
jgi:hypothetical protein